MFLKVRSTWAQQHNNILRDAMAEECNPTKTTKLCLMEKYFTLLQF